MNQQSHNSPQNQYSGPEDIYRELVDESQDSWLFGLLAFAIVEEQKIEWIKHYRGQHQGEAPTPSEIEAWYQQQPPSVLLRAKGTAENALQVYSGEIEEALDKERKKSIEEGIIVDEIRDLKRFWPQFGINVASGIISSFIFALLLVALAIVLLNDTSPNSLAEKAQNKLEVIENGKNP